jgi:hypothetical protein
MDEEQRDPTSEDDLLIVPGDLEFMVPIERIVESYLTWLEVKSPGHHVEFAARLRADPEAARAEAISFAFLRQQWWC